MKSLKATFYLAILTSIFACEKEEPFNVSYVTDDFTSVINISQDDIISNQDLIYSDASTLNIAVNETISDFEALIFDARINSLTYEITDYDGDANATLQDASLLINGIKTEVENNNLSNSDNANVLYKVENPYVLEQMSTLFKGSSSGIAVFSTRLNSNDASFNIRISYNLTVAIDRPQ